MALFSIHSARLRYTLVLVLSRLVFTLAVLAALEAQQTPPPVPASGQKSETAGEPEPARPGGESRGRTELNLAGQVDSDSGESRRNENVQFNLIDNNALKELNVRLGATATLIHPFQADRNYFGSEFGAPPSALVHNPAARIAPFRGHVFWTHNNSVFSARSFFQVGRVQPARENEYGFLAGVRLWRSTLLSAEASQALIRGSVNGNVLVPREDERTPLATDPAVRAIVQRYLDAYPKQLPNRTDIAERALNTNSPQIINSDSAHLRLEHQPGAGRLTARYQYTAQQVDAFQFVAGQNPDTTTRSHVARLTWNRSWSPGLVSDLSAGFDRVRTLLVPEPNAVGPLVLTGMVIDFLGPDETIPVDRAENRFRAGALLQRAGGRHTSSFGFDTLRRQINGSEQQAHRGIFVFAASATASAIENIRRGIPNRYTASIGDVHRGFRSWDFQLHAADTWRATGSLTLTYGLRYQPSLRPNEVNGLSEIPYDSDRNNFAPRFGFAWRLGRGWGVWRGGYGIHYGEIFPVTYQQLRFNPPYNLGLVVADPYLANPLRGLTSADLRPEARSARRFLSPDLALPYSHQYNFAWEFELGRNARAQFGYVGSRTHKLLLLLYRNRAGAVPGIDLTTATINQRRPDGRFFDVYEVVNGSRGYYDAGKVSLAVPRWRALSFEAAYWFSKAIDLGSAYTNTAYDRDGRLSRSQAEDGVHQDMRGLSPFDQKHAFLMRASFETPRWPARRSILARLAERWSLSAVFLAKSGTPFEIQAGSDAPGIGNADGQNGDRVHILDASILGRTIGHPDRSRQLLPRAAFTFMRPGETRGNLGHHVFRKASIANVNAGLSRTWILGGDRTLQFRADSINFLNTPQFAEPGRDLSAPNFGQITNTLNDGRTFRLTLRAGF